MWKVPYNFPSPLVWEWFFIPALNYIYAKFYLNPLDLRDWVTNIQTFTCIILSKIGTVNFHYIIRLPFSSLTLLSELTLPTQRCYKYRGLGREYNFVRFGVETLGPWGPSAHKLFAEIAKRLVDVTGDRRAGGFLAQRISNQHCNSTRKCRQHPRYNASRAFF
jgi:hypothetical protein